MHAGRVKGRFIYRAFRARCGRRLAEAQGYTILEIMIVIGIMGILVSLAIAAYQDYTKRTRMIEVMLAAGSCRTPVYEAYYYGREPSPGTWGCEAAAGWGDMVQSIEVDDNGKVTVTARGFGDDDIDGKVLTLVPLVEGVPAQMPDDKGMTLKWRCGDSDDGTTIDPSFLPSTCRSGTP